MMGTYRRGQSVEEYFRNFSQRIEKEHVIMKEDFARAVASLGIEWGNNVSKVSEVFDSLDLMCHNGA